VKENAHSKDKILEGTTMDERAVRLVNKQVGRRIDDHLIPDADPVDPASSCPVAKSSLRLQIDVRRQFWLYKERCSDEDFKTVEVDLPNPTAVHSLTLTTFSRPLGLDLLLSPLHDLLRTISHCRN
jgi:hypothetical protein